MIGDRELGAAEVVPASAKLRHRRRSRPAESWRPPRPARHNLRLNDFDLPHQKGRAGFALVAFRRAIARRTALNDVRDVDLFAAQAHGLDHVVEQLPGAAHERLALLIFVRARRFADEHQVGLRIADSENNLLAALLVQSAAGAVANVFADKAER